MGILDDQDLLDKATKFMQEKPEDREKLMYMAIIKIDRDGCAQHCDPKNKFFAGHTISLTGIFGIVTYLILQKLGITP